MQLDFRENRTIIPPLTFNDTTLERVSAFKLLGLWIDDNLKWQTNTDYIIGKAVKRGCPQKSNIRRPRRKNRFCSNLPRYTLLYRKMHHIFF